MPRLLVIMILLLRSCKAREFVPVTFQLMMDVAGTWHFNMTLRVRAPESLMSFN